MYTLKNRSLATKISFPPLVVILLSILVTAYTWNGLQEVVSELTSITQYRVPQAGVAEQLAKSVLLSKEIVSNYLRSHDEEEITRINEQHKIVSDNYKKSQSLNFSVEDQEQLRSFIEVYNSYHGLLVKDIKNILNQSTDQIAHIKNTLLVEIVQSLHKIELTANESAAKNSTKAQLHVHKAVSSISAYYHGDHQTDFDMTQLELDAVEENLYYLGKNLRTMTARRAIKSVLTKVEVLREATISIFDSKQKINTLLTIDLVDHSTKLSTASDRLMHEVWGNVRSSTESSLRRTNNSSLTSILFSSVAILVGIVLSTLIIRAISQPIRESVSVANKIADGNLSQDIKSHSSDETGQLLNALAKMQRKIKSQLDEITLSAQESQRSKVALEYASSSIMLADHDHHINFMNNALINEFNDHKVDITEQLGQFETNMLIGRKFEIFSDDIECTRKSFAQMSSTITHTLELGQQVYKLSADPVFDEQNSRLGTVIQWKNITEQLQMETEVKHMISEAKSGNLNLRISIADKSGFFKTLSEEINELVSTNESVINDAVETLGSIATGDLTRKANSNYKGSYATLNNNINSTIDKLISVISSIKNTSQAVDQGARNISENNGDLSHRTQLQSSELDRSSRSMTQISTNVNDSAKNAEHANKLAHEASEKARVGGSILDRTKNAMEEINDASLSIRDIISVMDEIAFQTNLLALNASVEAAHAGPLGRGFAVVADEVRGLAQRSTDAAKEIKALINNTVAKVDDGSKLVANSSDSLNEIIESVTQVSGIIHQISNASAAQSIEIEGVSRSIEHLDASNQENSTMVEQTAIASESLRHQAGELTGLINFFSIDGELTRNNESANSEFDNIVSQKRA